MPEIVSELIDRARWQELSRQFLDLNFRQGWDYGIAAAKRRGAISEHVAIRRGQELIALADVRIKRAPLVGVGLAYISGGPLVRLNRDDDCLETMSLALQCLNDEYARRRGLILRIVAPLAPEPWKRDVDATFASSGFSPSNRTKGYRTILLDLARPLTEIRKSLAQKWRNCLNSAERQGLTIRSGNSTALLEEFCELFVRFHGKKGFDLDIPPQFYLDLARSHPDGERLSVTLCDAAGKAIAGHVASVLGDTSVYMFGASDDVARKTKASYLLQWQAIQSAHAAGVRWYDLGGIDPEANPTVFHFKAGLGGVDIAASGPFEMVPQSLRVELALRGEAVWRLLRSRRAQAPARAANQS